MVSVRIEDGAFARACTTALDAWWPRRVGWQLDNAGCALAGHLPATPDLPVMEIPARPIQPMVIWQHLVPEAGRNTVLARDAAEQVVERWPHEARLDPDGLTLWKTAALPLVPVEGDETRERTPSLDLAGIQTRLAAFWADTPGAVSRSDNGASSFTIRTTRPPAAVFERAARVPGIAPVRLIQSGSTGGGGNTLVLTPVTPRNVPVTMIGDNAIQRKSIAGKGGTMTAGFFPKHVLESPGPPWLSSRSRQSREAAKEASIEPGSALSQGNARKHTPGPGTAPDVPVGAAAGRRRCAGHLLRAALVALFIAPFIALNPAAGLAQTLGIDCDQPRRNADGKLILSDDGIARARCEADRATALNYAAVVRETRDRLRSALAGLPPPLWDDLVSHLRGSNAIGNWDYTNTDDLERLKDLPDPYRRANYWKGGILEGTTYPDDWRGSVRARACGTGSREAVLVWLHPGDPNDPDDPPTIRDRWTPEMVQRAVRAWVQRTEGRNRLVDRIPDIVISENEVKQVWRYNGRERALLQDCLDILPEDTLAMRLSLHRDIDTGRRTERCADPQVGMRRLMWARHNGIYIVPDRAIINPPEDRDGDGRHDPHPDQGEALLDPPVTDEAQAWRLISQTCRTPRTLDAVRPDDCEGDNVTGVHVRRFRFREVQETTKPYKISMVPVMRDPDDPVNPLGVIAPDGGPHPVWEETTLFCEGELPDSDAPDIPEPVVDPDWDVPDCRTHWGGRFDEGSRTGYVQTIDYPEDWPVDDVEIRTIEDDCFRQVEQTGSETRQPACPAGHSGKIIERRSFRWYNRDWAVPSRHDNGAEGDRTFKQARDAWKADPSQAGKKWYEKVVLVRDWHLDRETCEAPRPVTDTQTQIGTCPAGQTGYLTKARTLSWYNRDPGATPPHVITDREVEEAAAAYDANPSQAGLAWYQKVTATPWATQLNKCHVPTPPTPITERTCGNTCAERGGREGRNSGGE